LSGSFGMAGAFPTTHFDATVVAHLDPQDDLENQSLAPRAE
jgi:hypothetical protein